jgi:hypothetical protein
VPAPSLLRYGVKSSASFSRLLSSPPAASTWPFESVVSVSPLRDFFLTIAVRDEQRETTILLSSGQAVTRDLLENARSEGYEFELLLKPIHPEELIQRLKATPNRRARSRFTKTVISTR